MDFLIGAFPWIIWGIFVFILVKYGKANPNKKNSISTYDHDDTKTEITSSSSSSTTTSYTNPSTGLPMTTPGTGGVDAGGNPYGM